MGAADNDGAAARPERREVLIPAAASEGALGDDAPGTAEIWRMLVRIDKRLDSMEAKAAENQREIERKVNARDREFVRSDVFLEAQKADAIQMVGLEREVHSIGHRLDAEANDLASRIVRAEDQRRQDRALVLGSLAFPILVLIIGALLLARGAT